MTKPTLLAVLAHPDDESFGLGGTLAKYAAQGVDVHIAIATDGVAGSVAEGYEELSADLIAVRQREVSAAVEILGATLHMLGFRDSGYIGDPANDDPEAFININPEISTCSVVKLMRELQPQVVITHDETGGYFHPDHIQCWRITTAAFYAVDDPHQYISAGPAAPRPQRLFYSVFPNSMVRVFTTIMRFRGQDPKRMGRNKDIDFTNLGVPDSDVHAKIDYRAYWDVKLNASAQHPSQGGGTSNSRALPQWFQRRFMAKEYFMRAYPDPLPGIVVRDLFDGVVID